MKTRVTVELHRTVLKVWLDALRQADCSIGQDIISGIDVQDLRRVRAMIMGKIRYRERSIKSLLSRSKMNRLRLSDNPDDNQSGRESDNG